MTGFPGGLTAWAPAVLTVLVCSWVAYRGQVGALSLSAVMSSHPSFYNIYCTGWCCWYLLVCLVFFWLLLLCDSPVPIISMLFWVLCDPSWRNLLRDGTLACLRVVW